MPFRMAFMPLALRCAVQPHTLSSMQPEQGGGMLAHLPEVAQPHGCFSALRPTGSFSGACARAAQPHIIGGPAQHACCDDVKQARTA